MTQESLVVLFATHPAVNNFFITSDDQAFFTQEMADSHGQKLKDRTVNEVTREGLEEVESFEAGNIDAGWSDTESKLTPYEKGLITKAKKAALKVVSDSMEAAADRPAGDQPVGDQPLTASQPAAEQPAADQPVVASQPAADQTTVVDQPEPQPTPAKGGNN